MRLARALIPVWIAWVFPIAGAQAADWSLETTFGEKVDYDTNIELVADPDGYALGSISTLKADLLAVTPRSKFQFLADLAYQVYTGPGSSSELDGFFPDLETNYTLKSRDTTIDLGASYSIQDLTSATIDETGLVQSTDANQHTITVNGGIEYDLTSIDTFALDIIATDVSFSPQTSDLVPYRDLENTFTYTRALSPTMDGSLVFGLEFYDPDGDPNVFNTIYSAEAKFKSHLTRRLTIHGGAGINLVDSRQEDNKSDIHDDESEDTGVSVGPLFSAGFEYRVRRTNIALDISEMFTPTDFGDVQEVRQINLTAAHQLNEAARVSLAVTYSNQIPPNSNQEPNSSDPTTAFSIAPTFDYILARDWQLQLGYRLLAEKLEEGNATSNDFFISISRSYFVIP